MDIVVLRDEKNELDVEISSLTIAEILRVYVNKQDVKLAAWRRDHPSKNPVLHIVADNPKKALKAAIASLEKEIDTLAKDFSKAK